MPLFKELARSVFNNIDMMVWVMDREGAILLSEGKGLLPLGIEPGQLVGTNAFELYRGAPEILACARRALTGEEFTAATITGEHIVENRYAPIRDESGAVTGVVGVSLDVTERVRAQAELERQAALLKDQAELLDRAHDAILARRLDGTITYWNQGAVRLYGHAKADAVGQSSNALLQASPASAVQELERSLSSGGYWEGELVHTRRDGTEVTVSSRCVLQRDAEGVPFAVLEINTDITSRKRIEAEQAHARKQEEIIRAQALAITELSTPLIPISDDILVMPLIGIMDSKRAKQVMESLLGGLSSSRGRFAILDITGVYVVDTQVANVLIQAAQAARLLGTEVILTGIRPEVAQTLVQIGVTFGDITTCGTLQSGIAHAFERGQRNR
jgi:rsbT co-antagonist protein RsbR